ncbi:hypothetical protein MRBLMI12_000486 [Microbacterium sp. LMI12-1-1.1]|uniref:hypothetical protein n=1 Tax=Microbacterium sp. LMI12-1-1.1 TaxID=3135225 RepID=UPI00341516BA
MSDIIIDRRHEVRAARDIYRRRNAIDDETRERAVTLLAGHKDADGAPLWSMAQVAKISGAKPSVVRRLMDKKDHTGGRINPESFDLILEEIALKDRNESNVLLTKRIIDDGTSTYQLSKLIGVKVPTVKWRLDKARKMAA